jgi:hypothetical protein
MEYMHVSFHYVNVVTPHQTVESGSYTPAVSKYVDGRRTPTYAEVM